MSMAFDYTHTNVSKVRVSDVMACSDRTLLVLYLWVGFSGQDDE